MKKLATLLGGLAVLFFSGNPAKAQHPGFPNIGVTLSYPNFLPVFCQPEIPGSHRWGYGQYAAGKSGSNCNGQPNCPPGYLWCGHGSNYCPGHQPYFPKTIFGQPTGRRARSLAIPAEMAVKARRWAAHRELAISVPPITAASMGPRRSQIPRRRRFTCRPGDRSAA